VRRRCVAGRRDLLLKCIQDMGGGGGKKSAQRQSHRMKPSVKGHRYEIPESSTGALSYRNKKKIGL